MTQHKPDAKPITADTFLEHEAGERERKKSAMDATALRRFRSVVRQSAKTWLGPPDRRLIGMRARDGCRLRFEFLEAGRWIECFAIGAHHEDGLFTLKGPCPNRKRLNPPGKALQKLERLYEHWKDWDESEGIGQLTVTVYLHAWTPGRVTKYVTSAARTFDSSRARAGKPSPRKKANRKPPSPQVKKTVAGSQKKKRTRAQRKRAVH